MEKLTEDLIHRGWRRSGTTFYKPDLLSSCCPHYTIRLDTHLFKPNKDQRQSLNRFNRYILGSKHMSEATRLHPLSKAESIRRKQDFSLIERVHESENEFAHEPSGVTKPEHKFVVTLEPDTFTEEKFKLFENYQSTVHKEPPNKITRSGFKSFLCNSPILRSTIDDPTSSSPSYDDRPSKKLGSYHQCYRIDNRLVAIGVLDLLPDAVSAVYFMYHSDIHKWSPGKLSALRETALAIEGGHKYYMMGFYIHSCTKMRYKADFQPQHVLDPEEYGWDALDDEMKTKMNVTKYVCASKERAEKREGGVDTVEPIENSDSDVSNTHGTEEQRHENRPPTTTTTTTTTTHASKPQTQTQTQTQDETSSPPLPLPLHARNMPGIPSRATLESSTEKLSSIRLAIRGKMYRTGDLVLWDEGSIDDPESLKCVVVDLAAAVGLDNLESLVVAF